MSDRLPGLKELEAFLSELQPMPYTTPDPEPDNPIPRGWRSEIKHPRAIKGRGLCGVQGFIYTNALLTNLSFDGLDLYGYSARYCYPDRLAAIAAILSWDGQGDPPGPWVKEKVSERLGPGALK